MNPSTRRISSVALALTLAGAARVAAAPVSVGGGYDYYSGPADEINRSVMATVAAGLGPTGSIAVTGLRFDDSRIGMGKGAILGLGVPLAPMVSMHAWGAR